jgi:hypothetical protein
VPALSTVSADVRLRYGPVLRYRDRPRTLLRPVDNRSSKPPKADRPWAYVVVVTCRDEVLAAFEVLGRQTGRVDFSPSEVLVQVRAAGSLYKDSTVRTHVVSHLVANGTLVRSSSGKYRLARHRHRPADPPLPAPVAVSDRVTEDAVKRAVAAVLEADGWTVDVRWGRDRGIDLDARRGSQRLIIEAKGEAPAGPQQVSYFLGALGELVQRMSDPAARYALALPDHPQYRGLVQRLPSLARQRLLLDVFFVDARGNVTPS